MNPNAATRRLIEALHTNSTARAIFEARLKREEQELKGLLEHLEFTAVRRTTQWLATAELQALWEAGEDRDVKNLRTSITNLRAALAA